MSEVKVIKNSIHTAKIIIYKTEKSKTKYLLLKEEEGFYNFPGGAQDKDDLTLDETAKRELKEELNLTIKSCNLYDSGIRYEFMHTDKNSKRYGKKGILHAYIGEYNGKEKIELPKDILEFNWFEENEALELLKTIYPYLTDVFKKVVKKI